MQCTKDTNSVTLWGAHSVSHKVRHSVPKMRLVKIEGWSAIPNSCSASHTPLLTIPPTRRSLTSPGILTLMHAHAARQHGGVCQSNGRTHEHTRAWASTCPVASPAPSLRKVPACAPAWGDVGQAIPWPSGCLCSNWRPRGEQSWMTGVGKLRAWASTSSRWAARLQALLVHKLEVSDLFCLVLDFRAESHPRDAKVKQLHLCPERAVEPKSHQTCTPFSVQKRGSDPGTSPKEPPSGQAGPAVTAPLLCCSRMHVLPWRRLSRSNPHAAQALRPNCFGAA